jgi:hypothetical protein
MAPATAKMTADLVTPKHKFTTTSFSWDYWSSHAVKAGFWHGDESCRPHAFGTGPAVARSDFLHAGRPLRHVRFLFS